MRLHTKKLVGVLSGILIGIALFSVKSYAASQEYHWIIHVKNNLKGPVPAALHVWHDKGRREDQAQVTIQPNETVTIINTENSKFFAQHAIVRINGWQCSEQTYSLGGAGEYNIDVTSNGCVATKLK